MRNELTTETITSVLRIALYLNTFSVDDLCVADEAQKNTAAIQTVRNIVTRYVKAGHFERIGEERTAGRPRSRYRVTRKLKKRSDLYARAYPDSEIRDDELFRPVTSTFEEALRLFQNIKCKYAVLARPSTNASAVTKEISKDLKNVLEFLDVAFYEQSTVVRMGPFGSKIRETYNQAKAFLKNLKKLPSCKTSKLPAALAKSFSEWGGGGASSTSKMVEAMLHSLRQELPSAEISNLVTTVSETVGFSSLQAYCFTVGTIVNSSAESPSPKLSKWYRSVDQDWSFDSLYMRACFDLVVGNIEGAVKEWDNLIQEKQGSFIMDCIYRRSLFEGAEYRVARVNKHDLINIRGEIIEARRLGIRVEIISRDSLQVSFATGETTPVGIQGTIPTDLPLFATATGYSVPLRRGFSSSGEELFATRGVFRLLDVPGPIPMRIAVALETVGLGANAMRIATQIYKDEQESLVFVTTEHGRQFTKISQLNWITP